MKRLYPRSHFGQLSAIYHFPQLLPVMFRYRNCFLLFLSTAMLFNFPVLNAAIYHADDLDRGFSMGFGWHFSGRHLADILSLIYSTPGPDWPVGPNSLTFGTLDPFPFSWIVSTVLLALSATILFLRFKQFSRAFAYAFVIVFVCNPFIISNLIYRFDNIGMYMAQFLTISAFYCTTFRHKNILAITLLLCALALYQPFANMYLGLIALEALFYLKRTEIHKPLLISMLHKLANYAVASMLYFVFLKVTGSDSRGAMVALDSNIISAIISNFLSGYSAFYELIYAYLYYYAPLLAIGLFGMVTFLKQSSPKTIIFTLMTIALISFSALGPMVLLKDYVVEPRTTTVYPCIMGTIIFGVVQLKKRFLASILLPVLTSFVFVSHTANIAALQTRFEAPIFTMVARDVAGLDGVELVNSVGSVQLASNVEILVTRTPFDGLLIRDNWHTTGRLRLQNVPKVNFIWNAAYERMVSEFESLQDKEAYLIIDAKPFYKIYQQKKTVWIVWY